MNIIQNTFLNVSCGAAAGYLINPVGALAGGTVGLIQSCIDMPQTFIVKKIKENSPDIVVKIITIVSPFFLLFSTWKIAGLFGFEMSLKSFVILELTGFSITIALASVAGTLMALSIPPSQTRTA